MALAAAAVLHPVVRVLGPLAGFLARARRGGGHGRSPAESQEDLRDLVDLLEQRQVIEPAEREMIHSVFELGDTIVREVMVPRTDMVVRGARQDRVARPCPWRCAAASPGSR